MSIYNMIYGVNPGTFFVMPMLSDKHPDQWPRFRDCFLGDDDHIHVYTRVGGGNRNCGFGEDELYAHPLFVSTFDDSFDSTYATYVFRVPDEHIDDMKKIKAGDLVSLSESLQAKCRAMFPKLSEKFDDLWGKPPYSRSQENG